MLMKVAQIAVASIAFFLIGANVALLAEFGRNFSSWWTLKLSAVMVLLTYVTASMIYGNPDGARVTIGAIACAVDLFAFSRVWRAIRIADRDRIALIVYHPPPKGNDHAGG